MRLFLKKWKSENDGIKILIKKHVLVKSLIKSIKIYYYYYFITSKFNIEPFWLIIFKIVDIHVYNDAEIQEFSITNMMWKIKISLRTFFFLMAWDINASFIPMYLEKQPILR